MARVGVRMLAMILAVLAGALACRPRRGAAGAVPAPAVDEARAMTAKERDSRCGRGMFLGNSGRVSACEGRGVGDLGICGWEDEEPRL